MKKLVVAAVLTLVAFGAQAEKKKALADSLSGQGYGMAGCGLGSVVFGDKPGYIQLAAAVVNGTGVQTFAITSGTSNCGSQTTEARATEFVEVNKVAIETDMARGQGETVTALGSLLNCKNSNFEQTLKSNYRSSFPQGGASARQIEAVAYQSCEI